MILASICSNPPSPGVLEHSYFLSATRVVLGHGPTIDVFEVPARHLQFHPMIYSDVGIFISSAADATHNIDHTRSMKVRILYIFVIIL
jgi:hypothetical protein